MGSIYQIQGEYSKALEYYRKSLEIFENFKDVQGVAKTYHNIGIVNQIQGEYTKALEYYNKSLEIKEKIYDIKGIAATGRQIRMVHEDREKYGGASTDQKVSKV